MPSFTDRRQKTDEHQQRGAERICCVSPNRAILDELAPGLAASFPGASIHEIRQYPEPGNVAFEFGARTPDICFLDVVSDPARALTLVSEIHEVDTRIRIVVLLAASEPDLILKSLRLGAGEFVLHPFSNDQLQAALARLSRTAPVTTSGKESAKIYCVVPAKGASGASTVAVHLAYECKRMGAGRILLADLDPLSGTVSFQLKLKPAYSFADIVTRADSFDDDLWKATVTTASGIDVLLAPESLIPGIGDDQDAGPIINYARRNYQVVIVDAGSVYGNWNLSQIRAADDILLVTTNELSALYSAQRALGYLESDGIDKQKVRLVLNRYDGEVGLNKEAVATALQTAVTQVIPTDRETIHRALLDGKPAPPNSSIGRSITSLAKSIHGIDQKAKQGSNGSGGALSSLLSLFGRTSK